MKILRLFAVLMTITLLCASRLTCPAAETNCGASTFTTDSPDPISGSTHWMTASYCGMIPGHTYRLSRMSSITGVGTPGPEFTWSADNDIDIVWYDRTPGGFSGYVPNFRTPAIGQLNVYAPVMDTNQFFVLDGASYLPAVTGPSIVPNPKSVKAVKVANPLDVSSLKPRAKTESVKGATALLTGTKAKPKKNVRHIVWKKLLTNPLKRLPESIPPLPPPLPKPKAQAQPKSDEKGSANLIKGTKRKTATAVGQPGFTRPEMVFK